MSTAVENGCVGCERCADSPAADCNCVCHHAGDDDDEWDFITLVEQIDTTTPEGMEKLERLCDELCDEGERERLQIALGHNDPAFEPCAGCGRVECLVGSRRIVYADARLPERLGPWGSRPASRLRFITSAPPWLRILEERDRELEERDGDA